MSNKLLIGVGMLAFLVVGSMLGILLFGDQNIVYVESGTQVFTTQFGTNHQGLIYNNTVLVDHRYLITEELCEAGNLGMNITIYPCVSHTFSGKDISNFVDFSWHGVQPQNTSWVFVYEGELEGGEMLLGQTVQQPYQTTQYVEQWVSNHVIHNVQSFQDISPPTQQLCDLGTENNTQMFNVIQNYGNYTTSTNYCFTQVTPINSTAYSLSGNASIAQQVQSFRNVTVYNQQVEVEYMGEGILPGEDDDDFNYYKVSDATFQPNQTYRTKWIYTPEGEAGSGKWHIFGYNSNLELENAIDLGQYIYVDPEWTADLNVGIEAFWRLNETSGNIIDATGNGHDGVVAGSPAFQRQGIINGSVDPEGNQANHWDISNPNDFGALNNFTIAYWLYIDDWGAQNYHFGLGVAGDADAGFTLYSASTGTYTFSVSSEASSQTAINIAGLQAGQFYFITNTFDAGTMITYVNGLFNATTTAGYTTIAGADGLLTFGARPGSHGFDGRLDEFGFWTRSLSQAEVTQLYNGGLGLTYNANPTPASSLNVYLTSPQDNLLTIDPVINFFGNQTASGIINHTNATLFVWNSTHSIINQTTITLSGNDTVFTSWNNTAYADGDYNWNILGCGTNGTAVCEYALNGNFSFGVDTNEPVLILEENISDLFVEDGDFPQNVSLNYTVLDDHPDTCFYFTSEVGTNTTFTCNTLQNVSFDLPGSKTIFYGANDTVGNIVTQNTSFDIGTYTATVDNNPVAEGGQATFTLDLNKTGIGLETISATLNWNNTAYAPGTQSIISNDFVEIARTLTIPVGTGNSSGNLIDWFWNFTASESGNFTTTTQEQSVYSVEFDDCSTFPVLAYNFSLRDEETTELVNASLGANIQVDLEWSSQIDGSVVFTHNQTSTDNTLVICVPDGVLNSSSFNVELVAEYTATDHVTEFYYIDNGTISSSDVPENIPLYDLLTVDSTTFLFTFLDENGLTVPNAIIHTLRYYVGEGLFREVERSKEDNNGETHVHLVEEDVIYQFLVTLNGQELFTSDQYNAKCLSSPCSITLSAEPDNEPFPDVYNNLPPGTYHVNANKDTRQVTLSFNLNQTATMNLTVWTQNNNEAQAVASGTTTASSGSVVVTVPLQYGNATYSAVIYHNNDFVATRVVDLSESANDYFGALGLFLGALAVLCLALIGASHGEWVVVWTVLGMITVSILFLVDLEWYALLTFIAGAGVFLIKLVSRRRVS